MRHSILSFFLVFFCTTIVVGQHKINGRKQIEIPFELENDFIVIDIIFNELPLKFIFDTGAEYTILTKREYARLLGLRYEREFKVMGSDLKTEMIAYLARGVRFKMGAIDSPKQDILVMGDDYFQFESLTGVEVHGIIGANFFNRYTLKIDYLRKILTLYDPQFFRAPSGFSKIPIKVIRSKPYIITPSKLMSQDTSMQLNLLIDTGANLSLLLFTDTHQALRLPEKIVRGTIGKGLGGDIEGFRGRFYEVSLGDHKLNNLVGNYQEILQSMDSSAVNQKNGLIGNLVLKRFNLIIDYYNEQLYLKPNRSFKKKFKFDRSGILFFASGRNLNTFTINYIVPDSPADKAGLKKGDRVKKVNLLPSYFMSMSDLSKKLKGRKGKKIRIVIERNGEKIVKKFRLKDII